MSRWNYNTGDWNCRLQCGQCEFIKEDGAQCKNRTCIGFPFCWQHNRRLFNVKVKPSLIDEGEQGLFATKFIPNNTTICPHGGEIINERCLRQRYGDTRAQYVIVFDEDENNPTDDDLYEDGACTRGIGSIARGSDAEGGIYSNATIIKAGDNKNYLVSTRPIQPDEEIILPVDDAEHPYVTSRTTQADTRPC